MIKLTTVVLIMLISMTASAGETVWGQAGATKVLVGNVNDVANTPNPNDLNNDLTYNDPVVCSDKCFFQASSTYGGGWWAYTGTRWSPMNEQIIFEAQFKSGDGDWASTYSANGCLYWNADAGLDNSAVNCVNAGAHFPIYGDIFFTRWTFMPSAATATTESCDMRIASNHSSPTAISGLEWTLGVTALAAGTPISGRLDTLVSPPAATGGYMMQAQRGTTCPSSPTTCVCTSNGVDGIYAVWGFRK